MLFCIQLVRGDCQMIKSAINLVLWNSHFRNSQPSIETGINTNAPEQAMALITTLNCPRCGVMHLCSEISEFG